LALKGHKTLLVDIDEQANATTGMGVKPAELSATLNDLFADPNRQPESVIIPNIIENLDLLPAHPSLSATEVGMALQRTDPTLPDPVYTLKSILEPLEDTYEYIILDTPPSLGFMTLNALATANEVIIPAAASAYSEGGVTNTWQAVAKAQQSYNPGLKQPKILVTRVKRTNASGGVLEGLKEDYLNSVIPQFIVESTAVDEAEQLNQPVVVYDPENVAAKGYIQVAEIISNG
jgi:chromosome partitioning protein